MNFGKALVMARNARGLSQKELAERVGKDQSYVSLIERGKRSPTLRVLEELGRALKIPVYLLTLLAADREDVGSLPEEKIRDLGQELLGLLMDAESEFKGSSSAPSPAEAFASESPEFSGEDGDPSQAVDGE